MHAGDGVSILAQTRNEPGASSSALLPLRSLVGGGQGMWISEGPLTPMLIMSPIQGTNNRADAQKRRKEAGWSLR